MEIVFWHEYFKMCEVHFPKHLFFINHLYMHPVNLFKTKLFILPLQYYVYDIYLINMVEVNDRWTWTMWNFVWFCSQNKVIKVVHVTCLSTLKIFMIIFGLFCFAFDFVSFFSFSCCFIFCFFPFFLSSIFCFFCIFPSCSDIFQYLWFFCSRSSNLGLAIGNWLRFHLWLTNFFSEKS